MGEWDMGVIGDSYWILVMFGEGIEIFIAVH